MKILSYSFLFLLLIFLKTLSGRVELIPKEVNEANLKLQSGINQKLNKINIVDTIIGGNFYKVVWFNDGIVKFEMNHVSDSIKWFPYDELADKENHSAIILPYKKKAEKIVITKSKIYFSLVDFKGRAVLFNLNVLANNKVLFSKNTKTNPIIRESRFVYINIKKDLIINNGGKHKLADGLIGKSYDIYEYKIDKNIKLERSYQTKVKNKQPKKQLDLGNASDAIYFYSKIDK